MGIFQGDVVIAEAIRQGIDDLRKNPWIIDDIFSSFTSDTLKDKYGQKEIDAAKDWFMNNKIEVNLRYRNDKDQYPCVTIALGSSGEKEDMKHLGDLSTCVETLMPNTIGKPISYITKPFVPESYDLTTGEVVFPSSVKKRGIRAGQILVDPDTGNGYIIQEVTPNGVRLEPGLELTLTRAGVVPKYQFYQVRRRHAFLQETYTIGCHTHGDPATLLWLHSIVLYCLFRYRQYFLEAKGFTQSTFSSTDMVPNQNFDNPGGENAFSRYINITGQVENTWVDIPERIIEAVEIEDVNGDVIKSGIKILSNLDSPEILDNEDEIWTTKEDEED